MRFDTFLSALSKPARSALTHRKINSFEKLARFTEQEILALHGIGPASLPTMKKELSKVGLQFKKEKSH